MVENKNPEDNKTAPGADDPQNKDGQFEADLEEVKEKKRKQLLHTKKRVEEQLSALGGDAGDDNIDMNPLFEEEDDKPLTLGDLKRMDAAKATQTALELANAISDPVERELVKHHIQNTIRPSGNSQIDLDNARAIVNQKKNAEILSESERRGKPKAHSSAGGAPETEIPKDRELTAAELKFTRPPFNLSKEDILKQRPKFDEKKK